MKLTMMTVIQQSLRLELLKRSDTVDMYMCDMRLYFNSNLSRSHHYL